VLLILLLLLFVPVASYLFALSVTNVDVDSPAGMK